MDKEPRPPTAAELRVALERARRLEGRWPNTRVNPSKDRTLAGKKRIKARRQARR